MVARKNLEARIAIDPKRRDSNLPITAFWPTSAVPPFLGAVFVEKSSK
jgi:hypothetical protein